MYIIVKIYENALKINFVEIFVGVKVLIFENRVHFYTYYHTLNQFIL